MKLYVHDEVVFYDADEARETVAEAYRTIFTPAGYRYVDPVPSVVRSYVGTPTGGQDWTRLRPRLDRRGYDGSPPGELLYPRGPSTAWQAGGPFMQKQALLRAYSPGAGDAQAELPEKR